MAAPATIRSGVGLRHVQVLAIASDGYINATATTAYEGFHVSGAKTMGLTPPTPRNITHTGDDGVFQLDVLPPNTALQGTLTTGKINDTLDAALTDKKAFTVGEANMFGIATEKAGLEKDMVLLVFYQSRDTDPDSSDMGERLWESLIFPKAMVVPQQPGPNANTQDVQYSIVPQFVTAHVWGVSFTEATEGFLRAQGLRAVTKYKPKIVGFNGDNSCTSFLFNTSYPAADTNKTKVWIDGVEQTTGFTCLTTGVTFSAAPGTNANITVWYEYD